MEIHLNGSIVSISACNIDTLVHEQGLDPRSVVVEYNNKVIPQREWDKTVLCQGDVVELLSFVGGG
ncbi:MAG: sulfur carrier protein ThiS [Desulfobacteraceae bacterium]